MTYILQHAVKAGGTALSSPEGKEKEGGKIIKKSTINPTYIKKYSTKDTFWINITILQHPWRTLTPVRWNEEDNNLYI